MNDELLRVSGVTHVFGRGAAAVRAVDGVSLAVPAGQLLLIMGPSGSGKTTLLTIIGGLLRPTSGSVIVNGVEITALSESQLVPVRRRSVGFVFQSFNLLESLTARENVELPLNMAGVRGRAARDRATRLLEERGLKHRLGFRSRDLSGGEKQRVSIARALANEPLLLLADEPTANLDSTHGRAIITLLREIARSGGPSEGAGAGRAVVVVSHDQRIREVADRVLWLEDGRIRDIGHMVRDPVCGMGVVGDRAVAVVHDGRTLHFCSPGCSREFAASPQRFLAGAGEGRV